VSEKMNASLEGFFSSFRSSSSVSRGCGRSVPHKMESLSRARRFWRSCKCSNNKFFLKSVSVSKRREQ
jgi:hypothetical protein